MANCFRPFQRERDPASEASPLLPRRKVNPVMYPITTDVPLKRSSRRSPPKSPLSPGSRKSPGRFVLPVAVSIHPEGRPPDPSMWDQAERMHVSDDPTRPPSEEISFRDPTPSEERPPGSRNGIHSPDDPRLEYANPYSR
ncbi:hypothetical protein AAVH_27334 [Aphelenchoides avenae]|nr:hypothetical protein AAVH_27334 [Aphelenchus avenae]